MDYRTQAHVHGLEQKLSVRMEVLQEAQARIRELEEQQTWKPCFLCKILRRFK